ncbi:MAG: putative deoxyribonuclease YcfH [Myxococcales bacterium]|nr:putative deoxyribonuclease YcfH [Myxococcales bacterium]
MFDTHCHLQEFDDATAVVERARAAGVARILLAGVGPAQWQKDDALVAAHDELCVSFGLHPQLVHELSDGDCDRAVEELDARLARRDGRVVAIGEIGLDGMGERIQSLPRQERIFRAQLALARKHQLPVAFHVLRQHPRALAVLHDEPLPAGGVLHSCSSSPELTRDWVALGFHVSFSGSVTWHGGDNKAARSVAVVPRDRLVVETDAPDQTPEPHRPGRNEPAFLVAIVRAVAHLWGVEFADAARITDENARRLFFPKGPP